MLPGFSQSPFWRPTEKSLGNGWPLSLPLSPRVPASHASPHSALAAHAKIQLTWSYLPPLCSTTGDSGLISILLPGHLSFLRFQARSLFCDISSLMRPRRVVSFRPSCFFRGKPRGAALDWLLHSRWKPEAFISLSLPSRNSFIHPLLNMPVLRVHLTRHRAVRRRDFREAGSTQLCLRGPHSLVRRPTYM